MLSLILHVLFDKCLSNISVYFWSQRKNIFQADVASTLIWVSVLISVELLWNLLTCISRFTTDLWHRLQKGLFFKCKAFLCRSIFLFLGKTLWQISQGNWPRLPSCISDMWTRRFFWLPKYLLHTPHMYCFPAASGLFSLVPGTGSGLEEEEGSNSLGTFMGDPDTPLVSGVPDRLGDSATILPRGWGVPTTTLGVRGLLLIAVVTSCCCWGCCCTRL